MVENKKMIIRYLEASINGIWKILPLYEEQNVGIETYVGSLLFTLYGLDKAVLMNYSHEYVTLVSTLESVKNEIVKKDSEHAVVKREIFKCVNIVNTMILRLEKSVKSDE